MKESGDKLMGLTEEAYQEWKTLEEEILSALATAVQKGSPRRGGGGAYRSAPLPVAGLYSAELYPQIQMGLAEMYVADQRSPTIMTGRHPVVPVSPGSCGSHGLGNEEKRKKNGRTSVLPFFLSLRCFFLLLLGKNGILIKMIIGSRWEEDL